MDSTLPSESRNTLLGINEWSSFVTLTAFFIILLHHTRRSAPKYPSNFGKIKSSPLLFHVLASSFELLTYHCSSSTASRSSDLLDLFACLLQSATNLILAKMFIRGEESTGPSYQAAGLIRPIVGLVAFVSGSDEMHRASVKLLNAFIYTRIMIFVALRFE